MPGPGLSRLYLLQNTYRDVLEVIRGPVMKCWVTELHAFLLWGNKIIRRPLNQGTITIQVHCGVYVTNREHYDALSLSQVPVYWLLVLLSLDCYALLKPLSDICEMSTWNLLLSFKVDRLVHTKNFFTTYLLWMTDWTSSWLCVGMPIGLTRFVLTCASGMIDKKFTASRFVNLF